MARRCLAGLANARVEPHVGDELARRLEAPDVADRRPEGRRGDEVHPRHAHQPADLRGLERGSRQRALRLCDLPVEEVDLAQTAGHGLALVGGQRERLEPRSTADPEDVADRRLFLQVAGEHGVELVLCPGALANEGGAAGHPAPQRPRPLPRPPDLGQKPAASSSQSVRASSLSVFTFASAIARSLRVLAIATRPTWG